MIRHLKREKTIRILVMYFIAVLVVTFGFRSFENETNVVLNPIKTHILFIRSARLAFQENGWFGLWHRFLWYYEKVLRSFFLNILLFIPLGYLVPYTFSFFRRLWKIFFLGLGASLFIESMQLITHLGWFDASDLLHNTLGALVGYGVYWKLLRGTAETETTE